MSDDDSSPESEADINAIYIAQFRHHISQVQAHLAGTDNLRSLSSYIPPTGYWTAEEKDNFFHALSVHSRFRPDLIAACIKTKTILDVCTYIDALDNALCRNQSLPSLRSDLECAIEVSDSWVQWEEAYADDLVDVEPKWEEMAVEQQHREEISAEGASVKTIMAAGNAGANPVAWERDRRRYWKQERVLKRLEFHHLRVLEGLLRQTDSGVTDADADEMHPEDQHHQDSIPVVSPPLLPTTPTTSCLATGDDMIDPLLLHLSQPVPIQVLPRATTSTFAATDQSLLPPEPSSSFQARNTSSHSPPPSVTLLHPSHNDSSSSLKVYEARGTDPSDLTPSSRRRLQKRLYMRRKRAEQNGEQVVSDGAKLRPGRKVKERRPPKPRPKFYKTKNKARREGGDVHNATMDVEAPLPTMPMASPHAVRSLRDEGRVQEHNANGSSQHHEQTENSDDDDDDRQQRHAKGGLTRPYRIKKDLAENGIDGKTLIDGNLGLFHLSFLGQLMKLYKAGYDKSTTNTATAISAHTIRLLTAIMEEFITEVVHRTIILREQEKEMKGDIKVYGRSHDEVTVEIVEYVLEMMGMGGLTKEKYFARLLGEDGTSKGKNETGEQQFLGDDEGGSSIEGSPGLPDTHQSSIYPALLPLHRELHPPLIHLPKSLALPSERAASNDEDLCMPAHTDEEDLEAELQEERDLDEEDILLAHEYEVDLWKQFGLEHKYKGTRKRSGKRAGK